MGNTIEESAVYLFPFIIEFSMIGTHIIYNMWKNVGKTPKESIKLFTLSLAVRPNKFILCQFAMVGGEAGQEKSGRRLDYSGSESGLFVGLLALVSI